MSMPVEMALSLKHADACVPVTALKIIDWDQRNLVIQGQGPFARVIDEATGDVVTQTRVFKRNNVHGFILLPQIPHQDGRNQTPVIAWGGQSLRALNLFLGPESAVELSASSAEFLAPDWIMSGCAAIEDQRDTAFLITANNALLHLVIEPVDPFPDRTKLVVHQLATSVKSILYAADLIAISPSHVLITAGTAFGEIIVWSCFIDSTGVPSVNATASIHHFFTGHDGSIFGVRISPRIPSLNGGQSGRLFASCSDDRTVRIWDISNCEYKTWQDPSAYSTDGFELRSTGFGSVAANDTAVGSEACVAKAFGHVSRIWGVNFRSWRSDNPCNLGLVSRGEDGQCVIWKLSWKSSSPASMDFELQQTSVLRRHSGKHIWSLDLCARGTETVVYTGGADGSLKSLIIDEARPSLPPNEPKTKTRESKTGIKAFAFVAWNCFLACSAENGLHIGRVSSSPATDITWQKLCVAEDLRSSAVMAGIPSKGVALISNSQGRIRLYNHRTQSLLDLVEQGPRTIEILPLETSRNDLNGPPGPLFFLVVHTTDEKTTFLSIAEWDTDCPKVETFTLDLPPSSFAVSSACLTHNDDYLLVGSKLGGLALYRVSDNGGSPGPLLVRRRVHGREGTNAVRVVPLEATETTSLEYVMSCGRDGTYCLHEIQTGSDAHNTASIETIHQTPSGIDGNLEGMYVDASTGDLMIYGFRAQSFVLRNESKQADIVSIASGGARRVWAFYPGVHGKSEALFLWKEGFTLHTHRIRADLTRSLRIGGHGREIKTMDGFRAPHGERSFFATGAEDTVVRIFTSSSPASAGPWGCFESLRGFDTHLSGIQQVTWSEDGQYLFTSGAYEEFFVWRIRWVPSFGIAAVLVASSPKENPDSELRITSFDLVEMTKSDSGRGFLICLTLSNSMIKIFHFSPTDENQFTFLAKGKYMTNCLTQAHLLLKDSSLCLMTTATDGHLTLWDLTATLEPFYIIDSSKLALRHSQQNFPVSPVTIACDNRYQVHSNSIKTMQVVQLSNSVTAILTGGDDNSLSVSLLKTSPDAPSLDAHLASLSIPDAHAASVTVLTVIDQQLVQSPGSNTQTTRLTVASSGNDHRVKVWSIDIDPVDPGTQNVSIKLLIDRYSSVADISAMGLIQCSGTTDSQARESNLLVCGVGMEMLEITLE